MSHKYRHLFKDEAEWDFFLKLGAALHDPTEKKEFFAAVVEGKQRDPNYEITGYVPKKVSIPAQILSMLEQGNKQRVERVVEPAKNKELENLAKLFGKLIEEGKHLQDKESA